MNEYWTGFCHGLAIGLFIASLAVMAVRLMFAAARLKSKGNAQ